MIAEEMGIRLRQAAASVLEMMFMSPVLDDHEFPPHGAVDPVLIGLRFEGEVGGEFAMAVEFETALWLAKLFLGVEPSEPMERHGVIEVLAELANMLCGSFLGQLHYTNPFQLSSPAQIRLEGFSPKGQTYQRTILLEGGILSILVAIESEAFGK